VVIGGFWPGPGARERRLQASQSYRQVAWRAEGARENPQSTRLRNRVLDGWGSFKQPFV